MFSDLTKTLKTLLKSFALRAMVCYRHEFGRKYTYSIFLPIPFYVLSDIKTFKKKNNKNRFPDIFKILLALPCIDECLAQPVF